MAVPLAGGLRVKVGMMVSDREALAYEGIPKESRPRQTMSLAEVSGEVRSALWSVGVGQLRETDSMLGSFPQGATTFTGSTKTNVAHFGVAFAPTKRLRVGAQYTVGATGQSKNRSDSLIAGFTGGRSMSYAAFTSLKDVVSSGDNLSLTLSRPMHMTSGKMRMVVSAGADDAGVPIIESRSISLRPEGQETRADLLYLKPFDFEPLNANGQWFVGAALRHNPNHDSTAPMDWMLGAGVRGKF